MTEMEIKAGQIWKCYNGLRILIGTEATKYGKRAYHVTVLFICKHMSSPCWKVGEKVFISEWGIREYYKLLCTKNVKE